LSNRAEPWRVGAGHLLIAVRLTPKAGRDSIEGITSLSDGRSVLAAKVRAAPDKGAANRALTELIAKELGIPKSAVTVAAGHTARLKQIRVDSDPVTLIGKLKPLARS
jgi:uncharacterized protein (TIGR00251 family)